MLRILENALLVRLKTGHRLLPEVRFAVRQFSRSGPPLRIQHDVEKTGFSSRRFIEVVREQTGLSPKTFQRVRRFQQVLRRLHRGGVHGWAALAAECGYYDSAHFIHDFPSFSGMTPGEYALAATTHLNHVPLLCPFNSAEIRESVVFYNPHRQLCVEHDGRGDFPCPTPCKT